MKNEWLRFNCPPFPTFISCGKAFFAPGDVHSERIFPTFVAMFITKGIVYFTEGDRQYELTAGQCFIQTPGIHHYGHLASLEEAEYYWIHFLPVGDYAVYFPDYSDSGKISGISISDSGHGIKTPEISIQLAMNFIYNIGDLSDQLYNLNQDFNVYQDFCKCQGIFTEIIGYMSERKHLTCLYEKDLLADKVYQYIRDNFRSCLNLKNIAAIFHFSPDYISRCFKGRYGCTPSQYLDELKINYARNMLTGTNKSIEYIANEIGCSDISVFSRMFRHHVGVAPSRYRSRIWGGKPQ